MAYDDFLGRMPNRPSPASESGVLRVEGAAATPSRSPKGYERGHGMGRGWGSVGSAYEMGGGTQRAGGRGVGYQCKEFGGVRKDSVKCVQGAQGNGCGGWEGG